jgi:hypothetical protein
MRSALSAQHNKTNRNDARGIAQMMRVGLYRPVHVKTPSGQVNCTPSELDMSLREFADDELLIG